MSVAQNAQQLISASNEYVAAAMGSSTGAASLMSTAIQNLQNLRETTTNSITNSVILLGAGQSGIPAIVASATATNRKADEISNLLEAALNAIISLDGAINVHGETMALVGRQILQGGA